MRALLAPVACSSCAPMRPPAALPQYLLAHWLALWAPELGIHEQALGPYWTQTKRVDFPCGPCKDCEEPPAGTEAMYKAS